LARPGVRGTFSQPGPSHPAASSRLTRALGLAIHSRLSLDALPLYTSSARIVRDRRSYLGQAKIRGSRDERVAEAAGKATNARPPALTCSGCQAALTEVSALDTSSLRGIEVAYQSHCATCDQVTWAVRGENLAVRAFYSALEKAAGGPVQLGKAKAAE
jgi:hypothetical protein